MTDPLAPLPWSHPIRPSELAARKPTRFDLKADAKTLVAIAQWAEIIAVRGLRLRGQMTPKGRADWMLEAELEATVQQACIVTLVPVSTTLREPVVRRYLADLPEPTGDDVEMPEDDSAEHLPDVIDLAAVALEAFELALPLYPRAEGVEFGTAQVTEPGAVPLQDEDTRPFAALKDLMARKDGPEDNQN